MESDVSVFAALEAATEFIYVSGICVTDLEQGSLQTMSKNLLSPLR